MDSNRISSHLEGSFLGSAVQVLHKQYYGSKSYKEKFKHKRVQTDYRESESQTIPWEPPYQVAAGHDPEVLLLRRFLWGQGLPVGMHELEIINRMRMRRAWESILPPRDTPSNVKIRSALIKDLEDDEWAFREAEIQDTMDQRMELQSILMQYKEKEKRKQTEEKFRMICEKLNKRKEREMNNIGNKFSRELRKLTMKYESIKTAKDKSNIIKKHVNNSLSFSNPKLRFKDPATCANRGVEEIVADDDIEEAEVLPEWLISTLTEKKSDESASKSFAMCERVYKRNEKKLLELREKLESMKVSIDLPDSCVLLKQKKKLPTSTPTLVRSPNENAETEEVERAAEFLRTLVRGRAIQSQMFDELDGKKDLIEEMKIGTVFDDSESDGEQKCESLEEEQEGTSFEATVDQVLEVADGKTISNMLDFHTDEVVRLDEEKDEALALDAEKGRLEEEEKELGDKYFVVVADNVDSLVAKYVQGPKHEEVNDGEETASDSIYDLFTSNLEDRETLACEEQRTGSAPVQLSIEDQMVIVPVDQLFPDEDSSGGTNRSTQTIASSKTESSTDEGSKACDEIYRSYQVYIQEDPFKDIIERIMYFIPAEVQDNSEICKILDETLWEASKKTTDFQLNQGSPSGSAASSSSLPISCTCSSSSDS